MLMANPDNCRHGIHNTTRIKGKCVPDVPHITGNIKDCKSEAGLILAHCDLKSFVAKTGEGYSLHYYVDLVSLVELPGTPKNPNPRFWKR